MWNLLNEQLMKAVSSDEYVKKKAQRMKEDLMMGYISPRSAAKHILDLFLTTQR
jgi:LAO/AO transport system kinase